MVYERRKHPSWAVAGRGPDTAAPAAGRRVALRDGLVGLVEAGQCVHYLPASSGLVSSHGAARGAVRPTHAMQEASLTWTDWPARRMPARAALSALVIALTVGAVALVDSWLALLGAMLLLSATAESLLPSRFELRADGVSMRNPLKVARRDWARLGAWCSAGDGYILSGRSRSRMLRRMRGLRLSMPSDLRPEVERILRARLGPPATAVHASKPATTQASELPSKPAAAQALELPSKRVGT
jgi:hypothetical protein